VKRGLFIVAGLLAAIAIVYGVRARFFSGCIPPTHRARNNAQSLRAAVQFWQTSTQSDKCPTVAQLKASGALDPEIPDLDPWGMAYRIECHRDGVVVASPGPDRRSKTADDIIVPLAATILIDGSAL
jgi:hypothetical protein